MEFRHNTKLISMREKLGTVLIALLIFVPTHRKNKSIGVVNGSQVKTHPSHFYPLNLLKL